MNVNLQPIDDRVIIRPSQVQEKTSTGIYIPDTAKEKPNSGEVVAVGIGVYNQHTGALIPMQLKVGDIVLYGKYGGTEVSYNGETLLIMRQGDVFTKEI